MSLCFCPLEPGALRAPPARMLCVPGLSPLYRPKEKSKPRGPGLPCWVSHPRPIPFPGPPQHGPLPKEPTVLAEVLAEVLLTAAHLGPGQGGPGRGKPLSYCLQTPAAETGIPDSKERPLQPPSAGPNPGFFPGKAHLEAPSASFLSPLPLCTRPLLHTRWLWAPDKPSRGRQRAASPLPPPLGHDRAQAQPRGLSTQISHPPYCLFTRSLGMTWHMSLYSKLT